MTQELLHPISGKPIKLDISTKTYTHLQVEALLKKQIEICADVYLSLGDSSTWIREAIKNAPLATEVE